MSLIGPLGPPVRSGIPLLSGAQRTSRARFPRGLMSKSGSLRFLRKRPRPSSGGRKPHQWPFTAEAVESPPHRATGRRALIPSRHRRRGHAAAPQPRVLGHKRRGKLTGPFSARILPIGQRYSLMDHRRRMARHAGCAPRAFARRSSWPRSCPGKPRLKLRFGGPAKAPTQISRVAGMAHRPVDPARPMVRRCPIRSAAPPCLPVAMVAGRDRP